MATIKDGRIVVSCSWCHEIVELATTLHAPTWCPTCGHQADVARADCTCVLCQLRDEQEEVVTITVNGLKFGVGRTSPLSYRDVADLAKAGVAPSITLKQKDHEGRILHPGESVMAVDAWCSTRTTRATHSGIGF